MHSFDISFAHHILCVIFLFEDHHSGGDLLWSDSGLCQISTELRDIKKYSLLNVEFLMIDS